MNHLDLNGGWHLHWFDGQRGDCLERLLAADGEVCLPLPAQVPGTVHETLMLSGLVDEPALGLNSLRCRWVEENLWFYRRRFTARRPVDGQRAWLVFECLDLAAVVYLNGREVARHANYFYPCRVDVTDALAADGENDLLVQLDGGLVHAAHRPAPNTANTFDHEITKRVWLRKPQFVFGWDWSPRLVTVGIPGAVWLETAPALAHTVSVRAELADNLRDGKIVARAWVDGANGTPLTLTVSVPELSLTVSETRPPAAAGETLLEAVLTVSEPRLWWPVGHGEQKLYRVELTVSGAGGLLREEVKQIGFRHVRVNQSPHPQRGSYFIVEINRKPVFVKGANLVPADLLPSRVTPEKSRALVDLALAANFNCLRVWGGGVYESDAFYERCDERGVLVWQEFVFACGKYPADDDAFLRDVLREARHQVRRLAGHASLFVWCGNNEMELANHEWLPFLRPPLHTDHGLFHLELPRLLREEDPSRFYQPSSPLSPPGVPPNDPHTGDQHAWEIGFADMDFRKFRAMECRFPNEGGWLGPTALPTMRASLGAAADVHPMRSREWTHHDNAVTFWNARRSPDRALAEWLGLRADALTVSEFTYWAGLLQGEALAAFIKNFRRRMFDSAGAIFWMYNDAWPSVRSWSVVDYHLRRTPSYHPVRRAFAPVTPVIVSEGGTVSVLGVNDGAEWRGRLRCGLCSLSAGDYPLRFEQEVALPANAATPLLSFSLADWQRLGVERHLAFAVLERDGGLVAQDKLALPLFKDLAWQPADIRVERGNNTARFTSDRFAWNVCLSLDGDAHPPDNFFDLLPNEPLTLPWRDDLPAPEILFTGNQLAQHRHD